MTRPTAGGLLRLAVAVALTGYVLWRSDPDAVIAAGARADLRLVAGAALLVIVDRTLMAWRWLLLLAPLAGRRPPLRVVMRIFFVSTFVGTFLPASVGGDAVRAYSLARHGVGGADAVASVVMDRVLGVLAIFLLGAAALTLMPEVAGPWGTAGAIGLTLAACAGAALIVFSRQAARIGRGLCALLPGERLRDAAGRTIDAVQRYAGVGAALLVVLAASVGVQILRVVQAWLLGRAVGIDLGPALYFAYVPVILVVMLLPITINGLGTSQAAFVWFFARAGVDEASAFTLSVLFVALGIVGNLPGGVLYATGGLPVKAGGVPEDAGPRQSDFAFDVNLAHEVYISPRVIERAVFEHPVWRITPFVQALEREGASL